jgi:DNA-binding transcriptional ArsR family regulator
VAEKKLALETMAERMKALAHNVRLSLLVALADGERSVGEIERLTGLVQPGLSQQLAVLRQADLVLARRESKQVFYSLNRVQIAAVRRFLDELAGPASPAAEIREAPPLRAGGGAATFARVIRRT